MITLMVTMTVNNSQGFFQYLLDCSPSCIRHEEDCTISELNANNFPIDCTETSEDYVALASRDVVFS